MILVTLYDTGGELVWMESLHSRAAALEAIRAWVVAEGRSGFAEGDKQEGGWRGGYWHDGQAHVWTNIAGPARTARETLPEHLEGREG